MRDIYHNVAVSQALNPQTATTTRTSSTIDTQSFDALDVVFVLGAPGDTLSGSIYWTLKIQHSDDDSSYADVPAASLNSPNATVVVDANAKASQSYGFGYSGGKRYVKAVATPTGTHSNGTPMAVVALKGHAAVRPVI